MVKASIGLVILSAHFARRTSALAVSARTAGECTGPSAREERGLQDDKAAESIQGRRISYSPDALVVGCSAAGLSDSAGCTLCRTSAPCTQKMTSSAMFVA